MPNIKTALPKWWSKSTPSETFPLATESKTAPLPDSQAYNIILLQNKPVIFQ